MRKTVLIINKNTDFSFNVCVERLCFENTTSQSCLCAYAMSTSAPMIWGFCCWTVEVLAFCLWSLLYVRKFTKVILGILLIGTGF
jgi:hypothetical protein